MPLTRREPRERTARSAQRAKVLAEMAKAGKRSKYRAVRCEVDGERFDSKREMCRWLELKSLEKAGKISFLRRQVPYPLFAADIRSGKRNGALTQIGIYKSDFNYFDVSANRQVVEDAKGMRTALYRWKKKHVEAQYGISIREL